MLLVGDRPEMTLSRKAVAELLGTTMLLAAVVGSGIMGERLSGGNVAIALLANALATGAMLVAIILAFGRISGAHFNPVVTLAEAVRKELPWDNVPVYWMSQVVGAFLGVALANVMFGEPIFSASQHARAGMPQYISEFVATFGLLAVIRACSRFRADAAAFAVAAYIVAGYWFTASTSFANPAVTLARSLTNSFAGIRPVDTPAFILAQCVGGAVAMSVFAWFIPAAQTKTSEVLMPHTSHKVTHGS